MRKEEPLISVIVPVYNVKEYAARCIYSICAQTYINLQIILVDDGSTDGSSDICDQIASEDSRISVIHKENGGLVSARKAGLSVAQGKYVTFVDGDDWIHEDTYGRIMELAHGMNPDIIAYGCVEEYDSWCSEKINAIQAGFYYGENLEKLKDHILMTDNFFEWAILPHLCDKIIEKSLLSECICNVPDRISFAEDAVCSFPCMIKAQSVLVLNITPYHYRQREGSIVRSPDELCDESFYDIYHILMSAFEGNRTLEIQLKYYMFFLFCLKGYSKVNQSCFLFPFLRVKPGEKILVYGAGMFGNVVKHYIENSRIFRLSGWTDQKADYYMSRGLKLDNIESVTGLKYDRLVIAILNEKTGEEVRKKLTDMGIPDYKIDLVRTEVIDQACLPHWLYESN